MKFYGEFHGLLYQIAAATGPLVLKKFRKELHGQVLDILGASV